MVEQIYPGIFRLQIPLRNIPLKATNAYLIVGEKKNLLIDTGLNSEECMQAILQGFQEVEVRLESTDIFLTHMHSDHSGLVPWLSQYCQNIYTSSVTAKEVNFSLDWTEILDYAELCGLSQKDLLEARDKHPGYKYRPQGQVSFTVLQEDDCLQYKDFLLQCKLTPGHTMGHMCLYEPRHNLLFAGDHLLEEITPNISQWTANNSPLFDYFLSLDKIAPWEVKNVFPGHRKVFSHHKKRVKELFDHHILRCHEILQLLEQKSLTPYQIASLMSWDLKINHWDEFPFAQKWFATGEALSHLKFLESFELIEMVFDGSNYRCSIKDSGSYSPESLFQLIKPYCCNIQKY